MTVELVVALLIGAAILWLAVRRLGGSDSEGAVLSAIFVSICLADTVL